MQMRDRACKSVADHRAWTAERDILADGLARLFLIARRIPDVVGDLIGLANLFAEAAPGFRVVGTGRSCATDRCGSKQRAGLRTVIVRQIDFGFAFPGLTGHNAM